MKEKEQLDITESEIASEKVKKKKKKPGPVKVILMIIGIILALALVAVLVFAGSILIKFHSKSYEYQAPVERKDEYVLPAFPEVSYEPVEAVEIEEETEPDEEELYETDVAEVSHISSDPLPSVVNNPQTVTQYSYSPTYNRLASFSNSNAVSVYGSVPIYKVNQKDPNVRNILLVGTDSHDVSIDRGRSDTMIVVSYNYSTGTVKLTSLLRDTLVPIEGHDWNRLNSAYAFGGIGLTINTINQVFNLDIQEFVIIDFNGVKDFIDYIGGVDVYFSAEEAEFYNGIMKGRSFTAGMNHLDAGAALIHMRNRKLGNDYGRTRRQRDTIMAVVNKIKNEKSIGDIYGITDYVFSIVKTNMSATTIGSLAVSAFSQGSIPMQSENVPFSDAYRFAWYNGLDIISYDIPSTAKRLNDFIYGY